MQPAVQTVARVAAADLGDGAGRDAHPHHPTGESVHGARCLPAHAGLRDLPGRARGGVAVAVVVVDLGAGADL